MKVKREYAVELKDLIDQAEERGWTYIGNNTVRRMVEHQTPDFAQKNGWWNGATYNSLEFLSFVFGSRTRVPKVVYGVAHTTWTGRSDSSVSYRRAVELLAQPVHLSAVHDR